LAPIITSDEDDACIQPSLFLKRTIPASGLAVFAKIGDILNIEEPAQFNETLARFLVLAEAGRWRPCDFDAGTPAHSALLSRPFRPLPCARGRI
jgi:3-oxoadipate enol-lactonase